MQSEGTGAPDVHGGPHSNRIKSLECLDALCAVLAFVNCFVAHTKMPPETLKDLVASCEEKAKDTIICAKRNYHALGNEMTIFPSLWNENVLIAAR
jgi:hypothetical protein